MWNPGKHKQRQGATVVWGPGSHDAALTCSGFWRAKEQQASNNKKGFYCNESIWNIPVKSAPGKSLNLFKVYMKSFLILWALLNLEEKLIRTKHRECIAGMHFFSLFFFSFFFAWLHLLQNRFQRHSSSCRRSWKHRKCFQISATQRQMCEVGMNKKPMQHFFLFLLQHHISTDATRGKILSLRPHLIQSKLHSSVLLKTLLRSAKTLKSPNRWSSEGTLSLRPPWWAVDLQRRVESWARRAGRADGWIRTAADRPPRSGTADAHRRSPSASQSGGRSEVWYSKVLIGGFMQKQQMNERAQMILDGGVKYLVSHVPKLNRFLHPCFLKLWFY